MTQLDLFTNAIAMSRVLPFPYARRPGVLDDIANAFVSDGYKAGNHRMMWHGAHMIRELILLGMAKEEVGREIDRFTAAARAAAIKRLIETGCLDSPDAA